MAAPLPTPRTTEARYLAAIHDQLVGLRADVAAAVTRGGSEPAAPGEPVVVQEPQPAVPAAAASPAPRPAARAEAPRKRAPASKST